MFCTVPKDVDLEGYTLIVAAPSIGNVGQLATDVLISSVSDIEHIGSLGYESVVPFVSANPFDYNDEELTTAIEVYRSKQSANNVVLIQIRSSVISKKCEKEFVSELGKWILSHKFSKVVILTSAHAYQRLDCQIQDQRVRYIASTLAKECLGEQLSKLDCKELEPRESEEPYPYPALQGQGFFHGAGYAKWLFSKCAENEIPCVIFMTLTVDGDNAEEAKVVAGICDGLIPMVQVDNGGRKQFKIPPSWTHFYGNAPPPGLY